MKKITEKKNTEYDSKLVLARIQQFNKKLKEQTERMEKNYNEIVRNNRDKISYKE